MEAFGMTVTDQQYERMRGGWRSRRISTAVSVLVFSPVMTVVIAGILFLVFNVAMGGEATFKQLFAVFVHAGVISALQQLFTGPLNYFRGAVTQRHEPGGAAADGRPKVVRRPDCWR